MPPAKAADAKVVLVIGDFFAQSLAGGLAEAFEDESSVKIEDGARAAGGLLRGDATALLPSRSQAQPAAVVILLGGNDRQSIRGTSGRLPLRSAAWNAAYGEKAAALAQAAASRSVPLLWVGLPSVASAKASADFLAFNETFRASAETAGGAFIDVWDGFVNENGIFVRFGPDVDGQKARLRTKDGVGFTAAGRRKLAFFVERPLAKLLNLPLGPDPAAPQTGGASLGGEATSPDGLVPMPLSGYLLRPGDDSELLGGSTDIAPAPADNALFDPPAVAGRADNFQADPSAAAKN